MDASYSSCTGVSLTGSTPLDGCVQKRVSGAGFVQACVSDFDIGPRAAAKMASSPLVWVILII